MLSREIVASVIIISPPFPFDRESRKYEEAAVSLRFRRLYFLSVEFNRSHHYRSPDGPTVLFLRSMRSAPRSLWRGMSSGRNHTPENV
ncbi:hypothetical protein SCLCIDRAFT_1212303 [Scleroderma citrinum Foug A]|uniref:Uncharacterized protein n=1 Tax=Scleroderma citrinum Foug A TaxID=1036808 RepID=A0A0C3EA22_9AGAM|nr:hypothetical protein SCLCIDRAFT_1224908 [Scleroderma citrinum Foug A]KIM65189.1 hypothetical protein SCLCIDRAFT_1212303 [Scleroderma citrinum Foug A]